MKEFATAHRVAVVAAAGCGKTNLIAESVAKYNTGRELILTHTHAGVYAIRTRMLRFQVAQMAYTVDTIAGWALKYAASYPALSGLTTFEPLNQKDWEQVYFTASKLLDNKTIRKVVSCSYSGMYVDEYQDCLVLQHEIIKKLADLIPCRVVGDPLQSIFGFGDNVVVDWEKDVNTFFKPLCQLDMPWRWSNTCPELGQWLGDVRGRLLQQQGIDLRNAPRQVHWCDSSDYNKKRLACYNCFRSENETACAILSQEKQCFDFACHLGGAYTSIETVECKDLFTWASKFEECSGEGRAYAVRDFATDCCTKISTLLKDLKPLLSSTSRKKSPELLAIASLLLSIVKETSLSPILPTLEAMKNLPGVKIFRSELYYEMLRALREYSTGNYPTLRDAAWQIRERTRQFGRRIGHRIIGRTLLIKGLEFDHCIILDADALDTKNLYVAMTRGSRSLTVFSKTAVLSPK